MILILDSLGLCLNTSEIVRFNIDLIIYRTQFTCKPCCLSLINSGSILPISLFGGKGKSKPEDCKHECNVTKSLYRL